MTTIRNRRTGQTCSNADVTVRTASYWVGPDGAHCIAVELTHHAPERWAVRRGAVCWNRRINDWQYETMTGQRADQFLKECRFEDVEEALEVARELALRDRSVASKILGITGKDYEEALEKGAPPPLEYVEDAAGE